MMFAIRNGRGKYLGVDQRPHAELATQGENYRVFTVVPGEVAIQRLRRWFAGNGQYASWRTDVAIVAVERATGWREVA